MKKRVSAVVISTVLSCMLAACGAKEQPLQVQEERIKTESHEKDEVKDETNERKTEANTEPSEATEEMATKYMTGNLIAAQTFQVELSPFGEVTFASYEPDTSNKPLADVVFRIEKEDAVLAELQGVFEDNNRSNEVFLTVEAVSFLDYNGDNYDDIIIICQYESSSGVETDTGYAEIRYYTGSAEGVFVYEAQMSQDANVALAEKTIESAKGFIGIKSEETRAPWKQEKNEP